MKKLAESDGICVVCCEMEKTKRKLHAVKRNGVTQYRPQFEKNTGYCQSCCEYICNDCVNKMEGWRCPVCRECVAEYRHKFEEEVCFH